MAVGMLSIIIFGLSATHAATAAPAYESKIYPEVIPGPGLPTLAELNLTSAQLHEMPVDFAGLLKAYSSENARSTLTKRLDPGCGPSNEVYAYVQNLIACYNLLRQLDTQACHVPGSYGVGFCAAGDAEVTGGSVSGYPTSSYCGHVALGVLWVIDSCTRPDQYSAGWSAAYGNGDLLVVSRHR